MVRANEAVFSLADEVLVEAVINTAGLSAESFRRELTKFLRDYTAEFYSDWVVPEGMGGEIASPLIGTEWANLSPGYRDSSRKAGRNAFYEYSGELKENLLGRNPLTDFGKPNVNLNSSGRGVSDQVFIDKGGRPQYRRGSGRQGFAPFSVAFSQLVFSMQIEMFPKIQGKTMRSVMTWFPLSLRVNEFGRGKMRGKTINHPARPLIRPFLDWYGTTNLRLSLSERFGIEV